MDEEVRRMMRIIFLVLLVGIGIKTFLFTGKEVGYQGHGFTIDFPPGWTEYKPEGTEEKKKQKLFRFKFDKEELDAYAPRTITYVTPERDVLSYAYQSSMTILSLKLEASIWLEDEMPQFLGAIAQSGNKIMDRGRMSMNDEDAWWVFYHNPEYDIYTIEFYIISKRNTFFKIQYSSLAKYFEKNRVLFERAKETFTIEYSLF